MALPSVIGSFNETSATASRSLPISSTALTALPIDSKALRDFLATPTSSRATLKAFTSCPAAKSSLVASVSFTPSDVLN